MNMHTPTQLQQHEAHKDRQARLSPKKPPIKIIRTETYYEDVIKALKHINTVQLGEIDDMKKALRLREARITELEIKLEQWIGEKPTEVLSMKEVCERLLTAHYPDVSVKDVQSYDTRSHIMTARQHCYYEVFLALPNLTIALKSKFFRRDHSSFRRGVKMHAKSIGEQFAMPDARKMPKLTDAKGDAQ